MTGPKDEACEPDLDGPQGRAGLDGLADAWIALWQSELAAMATDPEIAATWRQALGLGAAWLRAVQGRGQGDAPRDRAAAAQDTGAAAPGAAAAGAAPGDGPGDPLAGDLLGGADPARLRARIDELERRLAMLERGAAGSGTDRRKPRRRRPPA